MTREEAIKICVREKECVQRALGDCADRSGYVSPDGIITALDYVEALDMAIAALREQPQWISVEDRLPEDDPNIKKHVEGEKFGFLTVLVYNGVVKQTNRFFCNVPQLGLPQTDGWEWASMNVTHWMPLPSAEGLNDT